MTKQQVIDILEAYKPSDNIYNGYNSIEEKIDERICYLIDEIIESVKREPDNEWIKCSEKMPECLQEVLVCNDYGDISTAMLCKSKTEWFSEDGYYNLKAFTHWAPFPEPPKEESR